MQEQWRVFLAVPLPAELKLMLHHELQLTPSVLESFKKQTDYRDYHITVQFLGDVASERIQEIHKAMNRAAALMSRFTVGLSGWGTFGRMETPRVLWCDIQGQLNALHQLYAKLIAETRLLGFQPEERPYRPHITVARQYQGTESFSLAKLSELGQASDVSYAWEVDRIVLYRTHMGKKPMYEAIAESTING